jgi:hypothetical protein
MITQVPVIKNMAKRAFFRHLSIALLSGTVVAEAYWHYYVLPRQKRRDEYYERLGVKYTHPWKN